MKNHNLPKHPLTDTSSPQTDIQYLLPLRPNSRVLVFGDFPELINTLSLNPGLSVDVFDSASHKKKERSDNSWSDSPQILPFDENSMDFIFAPELKVHHKLWLQNELLRLLKPNGWSLFGFTNQASLTRTRKLFQRSRSQSDKTQLTSTTKLTHLLNNSGIRIVHTFGIYGSTHQPEFLIPLVSRNIAGFFFSIMSSPYTFGAELFRRLSYFLGQIGGQRFLFDQIFLVVNKPGVEESFIENDLYSELLNELAESGFLDGNKILSSSAIQIFDTPGSDRKSKYLFFYRGEKLPAFFTKVAHTDRTKKHLLGEYSTLQNLSHIQMLSASVPAPILFLDVGKNTVMVQRAIPGISLSTMLRRRNRIRPNQVKNDLMKVTDWLVNFQKATQSETSSINSVEYLERQINHCTRELERQEFELPPLFIENLTGLAERHTSLSIPIVARHGDFWPGNIIWKRPELIIIDWENFVEKSWPFFDLFNFFLTYGFTFPWDGWNKSSENRLQNQIFIKGTWLSNLTHLLFRDYFNRWDIPFKLAKLFYFFFLLEKISPEMSLGPQRESQKIRWITQLKLFAENETESIFG